MCWDKLRVTHEALGWIRDNTSWKITRVTPVGEHWEVWFDETIEAVEDVNIP